MCEGGLLQSAYRCADVESDVDDLCGSPSSGPRCNKARTPAAGLGILGVRPWGADALAFRISLKSSDPEVNAEEGSVEDPGAGRI